MDNLVNINNNSNNNPANHSNNEPIHSAIRAYTYDDLRVRYEERKSKIDEEG